MSRWRERAWKLVFFAALLSATALFLRPVAPAVGPGIPFVDKLQHAAIFAVLALLGGRAYGDRPRWGVVAALVVYGACIEVAQARVGRSFEILDILADGAGALAAFLLPRERQRSSWAPASDAR